MRRALALVVALAALLSTAVVAGAGEGDSNYGGPLRPLTLAVVGDSPYGTPQVGMFPSLVADINADPRVKRVLHLGDIKNGSSVCSDEYFATIRGYFDAFEDPLVYTPGDNEWTDCHRSNNGGYLPTERLDALRATFYPEPGYTLGQRSVRVQTQANELGFAPFVENQLFVQLRVVFSAVHVVGSNNDLEPWFGALETADQRTRRLAEYADRLEADLDWLDHTFRTAYRRGAYGVVIAMQADMWDAASVASGRPLDGFDPIVQRLADLSRNFGRPVLVLEGDSHQYTVDNPLAAGDPLHGVELPVPNLTRIIVQGQTASEWLRLRVDPRSDRLFSWERVQL